MTGATRQHRRDTADPGLTTELSAGVRGRHGHLRRARLRPSEDGTGRRSAGVARATLLHFRTRDLFRFVLRYGLDLHASFIRERVARARTASDRLEALIDAYVDFYSQYSSFTHVAIAETARLRPADDSAPMGMLGPLVEVTAETLADARQAGLLRELDPDICLSAFLGLVSSVPVFYAATNRRLPRTAMKRSLKTIFLTGVLATSERL